MKSLLASGFGGASKELDAFATEVLGVVWAFNHSRALRQEFHQQALRVVMLIGHAKDQEATFTHWTCLEQNGQEDAPVTTSYS